MLTLDLAEVLDGLIPQAAVQSIGASGVEQLHGPLLVSQARLLFLASARGQGESGAADDESRASPVIAKQGHLHLKRNDARPRAASPRFYSMQCGAQMRQSMMRGPAPLRRNLDSAFPHHPNSDRAAQQTWSVANSRHIAPAEMRKRRLPYASGSAKIA